MNPESAAMFQNAAYLIISLLVVGTIYTVVAPFFEKDQLKSRMKSVSSARDQLKAQRFEELQRTRELRSSNKNFASRVVQNLSLERLLAANDLKDKMAQAGFRGQRPIYLFYFFRLAMPIILLFVGLVFMVGLNVMGLKPEQNILATVFMVVIGYYSPGIYLKNVADKRASSIAPVFPDALDLLLICVESGMSVELAFGRVSQEMAENSIELAEEFSLTTAELSYLQSRRQAYENLARRNNHTGIKSVSTALVQAERYGTPLGSTLRTLANENRQMRMMEAEKKAAALPAKLTIPMILFFLPVLFIVILTPAVMRIGDAF